MPLDASVLTSLTRPVEPTAYLRTTPWAHRATPLGMGFGETRFASPTKAFKLLYIAEDLPTSIAETIIRDRFLGKTDRVLAPSDVSGWGVCEIDARRPLRLLDLRKDGCFKLGISTDIVGARAHQEARKFSQELYDTTDLDGIVYYSRLRAKNCIAVYDRAVGAGLLARPVVQLERLAALVPALRTLRTKLLSQRS